MSRAFRLPPGLHGPIEASARRYMQPAAGPQVDFTAPPGEPALAGPDSVSWQIFRNPVSLFVGGVAAVILELAEPKVRAGVWDHSSFRTDPIDRLQRTGLAAMVTVYGARSIAQRMIDGVNRAHGSVAGTTPEGEAYRATDTDLLDWVQATAAFGFLAAYRAYVRPVPRDARDRYYAEGTPAALLYGAVGAPRSEAEAERLFEQMTPRLGASPVIDDFLDIMRNAPILPPGARLIQPMLVRAAVALVPATLRGQLGLDSWRLRPSERQTVRALAGIADRLRLDTSPPAQACVRLGLPPDHLHRHRPW
jgi:uncharacterized protein (DUF2236 family)